MVAATDPSAILDVWRPMTMASCGIPSYWMSRCLHRSTWNPNCDWHSRRLCFGVLRQQPSRGRLPDYQSTRGHRTELGDRTDRRHTPSALRFSVPLSVPSGKGGFWASASVSLGGEDWKPAWFEHHQHGRRVDVVAVPLVPLAHEPLSAGYELDLVCYPVDGAPAQLNIANDVFVIGFPVGARPLRDGAFPIWTRGSIAWPPRLDWHGRPCFLIDSRTRQGQSGSPAVFYADATMSFVERDGRLAQGPAWGLVGVYGGRIHRDSDIGIVWKRSLVEDLVERGVRPRLPPVAPLQIQLEDAARFDES